MAAISVINAQKDDVGWSGKTPKLSKGPDILVDLLLRLREAGWDLDVTLVGPNRGYVRDRLDKSNFGYLWRHDLNEAELRDLYRSSQIYLCTSRVEGGPLGPFESYLCGCSVVSTAVGMVSDYQQLPGLYVTTELSSAALADQFEHAVSEDIFSSLDSQTLDERRAKLEPLTTAFFSSQWMDVINEQQIQ